jgi:hypothetical protein
MKMKLAGKMCALVVSAAMIAAPVAAVASTPGSVRDLVGARGSSGETQLEYRGFYLISGHIEYDSKVNYWWNGNTKECIKVVTNDGIYESIDKTTNADCNQKGDSGDKTAAIAVGAAALLGMAIVSVPARLEWVELAIGVPAILGLYGWIIWRWGFGPEDRVLVRKKKD